jgi:hypothetical protein
LASYLATATVEPVTLRAYRRGRTLPTESGGLLAAAAPPRFEQGDQRGLIEGASISTVLGRRRAPPCGGRSPRRGARGPNSADSLSARHNVKCGVLRASVGPNLSGSREAKLAARST